MPDPTPALQHLTLVAGVLLLSVFLFNPADLHQHADSPSWPCNLLRLGVLPGGLLGAAAFVALMCSEMYRTDERAPVLLQAGCGLMVASAAWSHIASAMLLPRYHFVQVFEGGRKFVLLQVDCTVHACMHCVCA